MKAIVKRDDLIPHGRQIKNLKLPKKLQDSAQITLSVSERLVVTGPAFGYEMNCRPVKWGTVKIPLKIWQNIVGNLFPVLHDEDISISAETFLIEIDGDEFFIDLFLLKDTFTAIRTCSENDVLTSFQMMI